MLQQNAVPPTALALLKKISSLDQLNSFGLGGGTSIALRMGHRLSIDLDFFTNIEYDPRFLFQFISKQFPDSEKLFEKNQTIIFKINDIRADFVLYPFPWSNQFELIDDIRFLAFEDIIPMKLQAVSNRNAKKDFWDIAALLDKYPLEEMLKIFKQKFPQVDTAYIIHSLTDFEKADTELDPDSLNNMTWNEIKDRLASEVQKYTQSFL